MKFLFDYFPIACFFIAFKIWGIYIATAVTMGASSLQMLTYWLRYRKFEKLHVITFLSIILLGGSSLIFHKSIFIKWKPTIVYWILGLLFLGSQFITKKPLMHQMLKEKVHLPPKIWGRINMSAAIFFIALGFLNLYVLYHYDTNAWVNFKLFGTMGLMFVYLISMALYISKYIEEPKEFTNEQ